MMMNLSDTVRVRRRFQRSIRVDSDIGAGALEGFVCPQGAADALTSMARQVREAGQGAFTWTGPYGCGKSSLAVAFGKSSAPSARTTALIAPTEIPVTTSKGFVPAGTSSANALSTPT